jgi:hypothetical protein
MYRGLYLVVAATPPGRPALDPVRATLVLERQPANPRWVKVCGAVDVILVWPARFDSLLGA